MLNEQHSFITNTATVVNFESMPRTIINRGWTTVMQTRPNRQGENTVLWFKARKDGEMVAGWHLSWGGRKSRGRCSENPNNVSWQARRVGRESWRQGEQLRQKLDRQTNSEARQVKWRLKIKIKIKHSKSTNHEWHEYPALVAILHCSSDGGQVCWFWWWASLQRDRQTEGKKGEDWADSKKPKHTHNSHSRVPDMSHSGGGETRPLSWWCCKYSLDLQHFLIHCKE